ncbi:RagB/SusD family nutrient uptake outer membrane protein [Chitinophaga oryziterrae]|uniref:RagB/SusD family nutrient uptake outer membrane protein n=1 Tax=Chitinophaga oryziterrae TaxID=1031224 RepID=A0A6N8J630_9BACT|nr:RagB/SusD family nutrient uptake outer membrane protein [Chitinophaga oryziterrae]MVT40725.1 RagB/SusD family nutrient uptake outer membrane protein [Chitinophaga oryziterrae]
MKILISGLVLCISLCACSKIFDIKPEEALDHSQTYRDVHDADAAVVGIYGKVITLAGRLVVLNELRGDLVDVTQSASGKYLQQLSTHSVTADNPYADPRPFYEVILNCNDALSNFDVMLKDKRMTVDEYGLRYSTVGAIRSWLYLQLGIQYGSIPYITDPLVNVNDLKDAAKFPRVTFDELLDKLLAFTEALPYKLPFPAGTSLLTIVDTYNTEKFFINIKCFLGDLYLWKGNYAQAALNYQYMMNYGDVLYPAKNSEQWYETYKLAYTANLTGGNWSNIFSQPYGERYSNYEIIWDLPFDKNFNPPNPFIDLFDNTKGSYQLKPSALAIKNWNDQVRTGDAVGNNTPVDLRGPGASWKMSGGSPVINKFTYNFNPLLPFETNSKWILYRAAMLHLRYAEAANRDGRDKLVYALLNAGIKNTYDPVYMATGVSGGEGRNVTDIEQTHDVPPYDFDARDGNYPQYRNAWYRNTGIRGRVALKPVLIDSASYFDMSSKEVTDRAGLILFMEDKLIAEDGLELAFEGNRWADLLRIALRRQASDPAYLANKVAAKFEAANDGMAGAVRSALMDKQNWYLPFRWQ